jgi:formamidopyrimidine-DNA glycosylase
MPELPEVESVARSLESGQGVCSGIVGRSVAKAVVSWNKTIAEPSAASFKRRILEQTVAGVGRRGKYIRIDLSKDTLLVHLRMSGDLILGYSEKALGKHSRARLYFDDGLQMSFNDPRKFGRIWLLKDAEDELSKLGPEPLDSGFTSAEFYRRLHARKRQLKALLLDQSFVAGIGNIYADEALHGAEMHPLTLANSVSRKQSDVLFGAIQSVLEEGIKRNGASIDWVYQGGDFQNYFAVYQQTGEACPRCGTSIERIVLGQRGTHFCPSCQPAPTK